MASRAQKKDLLTEYRRKQILDAALVVFSRKGYGEATIPDIARQAGIAVGTIYNYYPGKRDILVSILASQVLSEPFLKLMEESPEADDKAFLRALVQDRLTMLSQNADKLLFMVGEVYRDPDLRQRWTREVIQPAFRRAERRVQSRVDSGAFRPMKAEITVRALAGMAIGLSVLALIEGKEGPCHEVPAEELAAQVADIALMGVKAREGDPARE